MADIEIKKEEIEESKKNENEDKSEAPKEDVSIVTFKSKIQQIFSVFDKEKKNMIDIENIGYCIRKLGFFVSNIEIETEILPDLIERQNCINDSEDIKPDIKQITYAIFEYKMIELKTNQKYLMPEEDLLYKAFDTIQEYLRNENKNYDNELKNIEEKLENQNKKYIYNTKYIYKNDIINLLQNHGSNFNQEEIDQFINHVSINENQSKVQYEDYIDNLYKDNFET